MKTVEKEKICINCEGRISVSADVCPYCATDQGVKKMQNSFQAPIFQSQSLEDSLASLYTPPYQGKRPQFTQQKSSQPEDSMQSEIPFYKDVTQKPSINPLIGATVEEEQQPETSSLWPTLFLLAGVNFVILGLMQLFFSKNGVLRLEWDANYWFFYCLIGAPMLYLGFRKVKSII